MFLQKQNDGYWMLIDALSHFWICNCRFIFCWCALHQHDWICRCLCAMHHAAEFVDHFFVLSYMRIFFGAIFVLLFTQILLQEWTSCGEVTQRTMQLRKRTPGRECRNSSKHTCLDILTDVVVIKIASSVLFFVVLLSCNTSTLLPPECVPAVIVVYTVEWRGV